MYIDGDFEFGIPAVTNQGSTEDGKFVDAAVTNSTNILDAGSAKIVFGGERAARVYFRTNVSADTDGVLLELVSSSSSSLASGNTILGSKVIMYDIANAALGSGTQTIEGNFEIGKQTVAKQYYGLFIKLMGAGADISAGDAYVVLDAQTNMPGPRAATP